MRLNSKIYIAGHNGLVGSAIVRTLKTNGYHNLIYRNSRDLDLRCQADVETFFQQTQPEYVILAAAKVGGIHANNTYRANFIYDNLMMSANIIHSAHNNNTKKLLYLGSSCIYPKHAPQPIQEQHLLTGPLEPTNEPYAIAKIAGLKLCENYHHQYGDNFIAAMPTNLYGINDNFDLATSHVLPALLRKFHEAKLNHQPSVEVWGDGTALREFLFVDDLAEALLFLMQHYNDPTIINIGTGQDISIKDLALTIKTVVGYPGDIHFDSNKPNGTPRKLMDVSKLHNLGWQAQTDLNTGIAATYQWFLNHQTHLRGTQPITPQPPITAS